MFDRSHNAECGRHRTAGGSPAHMRLPISSALPLILFCTIFLLAAITAPVQAASCGFIYPTGKPAFAAKFDAADDFSDGLAAVKVGNKWGYIDHSGKMVITPAYKYCNKFSDGVCAVKPINGATTTYIDKQGNPIFKSREFASAGPFFSGLACVQEKKDGKFGYIDKTGKIVIPAVYDSADGFYHGFARVGRDNKFGFIDKSGNEVCKLQYDMVVPFEENYATFRRNEKWGYLDRTFKEIIPAKFSRVYDFSEGLAAVCPEWKLGFIDTTGKIVIEPKWEAYGSPFKEGLALVVKEDRNLASGEFIDRTGKVVIKSTRHWEFLDGFSSGRALMQICNNGNCLRGFIDKTGRLAIPATYKNCGSFHEGVAWVER